MTAIADIPRDGDGRLPAYAWPGGYPLVYLSSDGSEWCVACANQSDAEPPVTGALVHWEGPPVTCGGCAAEIESAYGDPDAPEDE